MVNCALPTDFKIRYPMVSVSDPDPHNGRHQGSAWKMQIRIQEVEKDLQYHLCKIYWKFD